MFLINHSYRSFSFSMFRMMLFLSVLLLLVLCVFYYSESNKVKRDNKDCRASVGTLKQHIDSLSAQLQVIYEHKTRLAKEYQDAKSKHEQELEDLSKKLGVVQKKHDTVQGQLREAEIQNDALQKDVEGLRGGKQADHEKAKKLNDDLQLARDENAKLVKQMESLKEDNMKLRSEVAELQGKLSSQNRVIVNEKAEIRDEKKQEPLPPPMKEKKTNEKAIADDIGLKKAMGNLQKSQVDSPKFAVDNNAVDNDEMKNVLRKPEISDKDVHQRAAALQAPFDNDVKALKKRDDDIDVADKDEQVDGDGAEIQQKPVDLLFDVKKDEYVNSDYDRGAERV